VRAGRASRRKPETKAADASRKSQEAGRDGGQRRPTQVGRQDSRKSLRMQRSARAGNSDEGSDGGDSSRRKPEELTNGKPETGSATLRDCHNGKGKTEPAFTGLSWEENFTRQFRDDSVGKTKLALKELD